MVESAESISVNKVMGLGDVDIPRLGAAAMRLVVAIEQGALDIVWEAASALVRRSVQKEAFVATLTAERVVFGRGIDRRWAAVRIDRPTTDVGLPLGTYAVLEFSVRMGEPQASCREIVTLRREEGGIWRFTGYLMRPD